MHTKLINYFKMITRIVYDSTTSSLAVVEAVTLKELATLFGLFDYYPYYFLGLGGGGAILDGLGVSSPYLGSL